MLTSTSRSHWSTFEARKKSTSSSRSVTTTSVQNKEKNRKMLTCLRLERCRRRIRSFLLWGWSHSSSSIQPLSWEFPIWKALRNRSYAIQKEAHSRKTNKVLAGKSNVASVPLFTWKLGKNMIFMMKIWRSTWPLKLEVSVSHLRLPYQWSLGLKKMAVNKE